MDSTLYIRGKLRYDKRKWKQTRNVFLLTSSLLFLLSVLSSCINLYFLHLFFHLPLSLSVPWPPASKADLQLASQWGYNHRYKTHPPTHPHSTYFKATWRVLHIFLFLSYLIFSYSSLPCFSFCVTCCFSTVWFVIFSLRLGSPTKFISTFFFGLIYKQRCSYTTGMAGNCLGAQALNIQNVKIVSQEAPLKGPNLIIMVKWRSLTHLEVKSKSGSKKRKWESVKWWM